MTIGQVCIQYRQEKLEFQLDEVVVLGVFFRISGRRSKKTVHYRFGFTRQTRILCDSGIAYCSFPLILSKTEHLFYVSGALACNCVHGYNTEATGVTWEDFEANSTDAQIENLIVTKLNHSFN